MDNSDRVVGFRLAPSLGRLRLLAVLALVLLAPRWSRAQAQPKGRPEPSPSRQGQPAPIAEDQPDAPVLHTIPLPRDRPRFNMVDASLLPRDKQGNWVLDLAYKPLRVISVDIPGKGRRQICYLYYRAVNRTGAPRKFAPRFIMVNDKDETFEENVVLQAVPNIQRREDPTIPVLGGVNIMGILPPSTRPNVDDAVYGAATWEKWDDKSDRFHIYVRGLSDGYDDIPSPGGDKPSVKYKTLKIDFLRNPETRLADPPHEWVYW